MSARVRRFRPVAEWTGILQLPQPQDRRADGSVPFRVTHAPPPFDHLVGTNARLVWTPPWVAAARRDVRLSEAAIRGIRAGFNVPRSVDRWTAVSPLESLCAQHESDTFEAKLAMPEVHRSATGVELVIGRAPVQIAGSETALVRFVRFEDDGRTCVVQHYDRAHRELWGDEERMRALPAARLKAAVVDVVSLRNIEHTRANRDGFYVYGRRDADGVFTIAALEPRAVVQCAPRLAPVIDLRSEAERARGLWGARYLQKGSWFHGNVVAASGPSGIPVERGKRFLAVHLCSAFSVRRELALAHARWIVRSNVSRGFMVGGLAGLGHASLGYAEVVDDPFTGALKLDITYKHTYLHGVWRVVSGDQAWHVFNGSLYNGAMYAHTLSDLLVDYAPLFRTAPNGVAFMDCLEYELDALNAGIRIGFGRGILVPGPMHSCVTAAEFALMRAIDRCAESGDDAITRMCTALRRSIVRRDGKPYRWSSAPFDTAHPVSDVLDALRLRMPLPKSLHDGLARAFGELGAKMTLVRSTMMGGEINALRPRRLAG